MDDLAHLQLGEVLGRGGGGVVLRGRSGATDVAVKVGGSKSGWERGEGRKGVWLCRNSTYRTDDARTTDPRVGVLAM